MTRKQEPTKPLFAVKHDFYASLDKLAQESIMLIQAVEMALQHGKIPEASAGILRERITAFRAALTSDD